MALLPFRLIPDPPPGFMRTLVTVSYKSVIRSSCDYCGVVITGTNAESVWDAENEHRDYCRAPKTKPNATASGE